MAGASRNATHPPVNVIVSGHVDSGKSTLTGHLLHLLGVVSTEEINRMKAESTGSKMGSFCYAWVSDSSATEREHGVTTDISVNRFVTDHRLVTIIDSPGHRDFIPNMIAGANQAQSALMILDASIGNFEAGFMRGGQTREHLQLMASLGVKSIILVVNKMDKVDWCRDRFNFIRKSILKYVQGVGFTSGVVVPCSGFQGDNLMTRVDPATVPGSDWYKGPTLIEAIDRLPPLQPDIRQPVRLVVRDTLEASSRGILRIQAQILGGFISTGDQLLFLPAIETGTVTGM
ncbi:hypothetical protein H696_01775 [Fonticula alba]|uniref:Tr-type G domain-containing protein n=1 Tax=Fonticula alba TaxID=691883 RepID=A0A058ZDB5_FONAL|nr:hypothetical protein H696_01775 [Fonticula alba]KCV72379.1 hypothetical protein H696_01775 [Fonticula alba]|eukprot:XP_009493957.1 hypothetical protein H696_01775 [Fonticula alba]